MLKPDVWFGRITDIPVDFFIERGIKLVVLDVDNTLTTHDNHVPADGVADWLLAVGEKGIACVILSNNKAERVAPFAKKIGLPFIARGAKPLTFGLQRSIKQYGVTKGETAIIGDQLFTDMLCGNLGRVTTILVDPFQPEEHGFLKMKRRWEKPFLARYRGVRR